MKLEKKVKEKKNFVSPNAVKVNGESGPTVHSPTHATFQ